MVPREDLEIDPKMAPDLELRLPNPEMESNSAIMASSLSMVTVTARLPSIDCPVEVNLETAAFWTNFPANPTALPDPYLVKISGTTNPRLSVVTVTLRYCLRR